MGKKRKKKKSNSKKAVQTTAALTLTEKLKTNEVWFTTVAALLLSMMALFLTCNSNKLLERQMRMDKATYEPDFYIYKSFKSSANSNIIDDVEITIENRNNGVIRNLRVETSNFLNVRVSPASFSGTSNIDSLTKIKKFLILDHFNAHFNQSKNPKIIYRIASPNIRHRTLVGDSAYSANQEQRIQLYQFLALQKLKERNQYIRLRRQLVLKISYLNFLDEEQTKYYSISLAPIKEETYAPGQNLTWTGVAFNSQEEGELAFNPKEKMNYVSFVTINSVDAFLSKIDEKEVYLFEEIYNIRDEKLKMNSGKSIGEDSTRIARRMDAIDMLKSFEENRIRKFLIELDSTEVQYDKYLSEKLEID